MEMGTETDPPLHWFWSRTGWFILRSGDPRVNFLRERVEAERGLHATERMTEIAIPASSLRFAQPGHPVQWFVRVCSVLIMAAYLVSVAILPATWTFDLDRKCALKNSDSAIFVRDAAVLSGVSTIIVLLLSMACLLHRVLGGRGLLRVLGKHAVLFCRTHAGLVVLWLFAVPLVTAYKGAYQGSFILITVPAGALVDLFAMFVRSLLAVRLFCVAMIINFMRHWVDERLALARCGVGLEMASVAIEGKVARVVSDTLELLFCIVIVELVLEKIIAPRVPVTQRSGNAFSMAIGVDVGGNGGTDATTTIATTTTTTARDTVKPEADGDENDDDHDGESDHEKDDGGGKGTDTRVVEESMVVGLFDSSDGIVHSRRAEALEEMNGALLGTGSSDATILTTTASHSGGGGTCNGGRGQPPSNNVEPPAPSIPPRDDAADGGDGTNVGKTAGGDQEKTDESNEEKAAPPGGDRSGGGGSTVVDVVDVDDVDANDHAGGKDRPTAHTDAPFGIEPPTHELFLNRYEFRIVDIGSPLHARMLRRAAESASMTRVLIWNGRRRRWVDTLFGATLFVQSLFFFSLIVFSTYSMLRSASPVLRCFDGISAIASFESAVGYAMCGVGTLLVCIVIAQWVFVGGRRGAARFLLNYYARVNLTNPFLVPSAFVFTLATALGRNVGPLRIGPLSASILFPLLDAGSIIVPRDSRFTAAAGLTTIYTMIVSTVSLFLQVSVLADAACPGSEGTHVGSDVDLGSFIARALATAGYAVWVNETLIALLRKWKEPRMPFVPLIVEPGVEVVNHWIEHGGRVPTDRTRKGTTSKGEDGGHAGGEKGEGSQTAAVRKFTDQDECSERSLELTPIANHQNQAAEGPTQV